MALQLLLVAAAALLVLYTLWAYTYWARRGVVQPLPFVGDFLQVMLMRRSLGEVTLAAIRRYDKHPFVGLYRFWTPILLLREVDLIREVLIQQFSNFSSNENVLKKGEDPVFDKNPFFLEKERWKEARATMAMAQSPARVKDACDGALASANKLCEFIEAKGPVTQDGVLLSKRYTSHVAAFALFGVEGDSLKTDTDDPGVFYEMGNSVFGEGFGNQIKLLLFFIYPRAIPFLGLSLINEKMKAFFRKLIRDMVEYRRKEGVSRNDFIDYASKRCLDQSGHIDEAILDEVMAQSINSFIENFETSALTTATILLMLATHTHEQNKLRDELRSAFPTGKLDYEGLVNHRYLDQVLKESLRLYPVADTIRRMCVSKATLQPNAGPNLKVHPGQLVYVNVDAVHRDPAYYSRPNEFWPGHFSEEELSNRPKCTFLSFGDGPKICVGMRYAQMQVKAAVASLVLRFRIETAPEQVLPVRRNPKAPLLGFIGGVKLRFHPL